MPDETVTARPSRCAQCEAALAEADLTLASRFDKVDLPKVVPVVTRVERYAGHCRCCGTTTLAPLPEGLEPGTPFSLNIVALAMYLRFVHHVSYRRLSRLLLELFGLAISEGALDAAFQRGKPRFDAETSAILARLRRARIVCSDETGVRIDGHGCWNWVFQNAEVVIHVIRRSRGAGVVAEVMDGHRPAIWVSDLYGAQRGHADAWQICLAHQLRDCRYAIEAGDTIFAPRMKALLLRAVVLARRHRHSGRDHPPRIPPSPRARARCRHGARSHQPARPAATKALRQAARASVHFPRPSRRHRRQQQQRAGASTDRHLSQGHRRFPIHLGRRSLRRSPLRHRHRRTARHRRLSGHPRHPIDAYQATPYPTGGRPNWVQQLRRESSGRLERQLLDLNNNAHCRCW